MANSFTTNYALTKPEVGADTDAWGTHLNADLDSIDATMKSISIAAGAAVPTAGGAMTGALLLAAGAVGTPALSFVGDTNTGLYWVGTDSFAAVAAGAAVLTAAAGGVTANGTLTASGAATFNGAVSANAKVTGTAATTAAASLNLPHGAAPTSPVNGDVWTTTAGGFMRINGVTVQIANPAGAISSFNSRTGAVTLTGADVTGALGYTPPNVAGDSFTGALRVSSGGLDVTTVVGDHGLRVRGSASGPGLIQFTDNAGVTQWATISVDSTGKATLSGAVAAAGAVSAAAGIDLTGQLAAPSSTEAGYLGLPPNSQSANYTMTMGDRGKCIHFTANATFTIPANASLALPLGAAWEVSCDPGVTVTIQLTSDTLRLVPNNTTGARSLVGPGSAFFEKKKITEIWIRGDVT